MNSPLALFSTEEGNLLIRLLLAHIGADFIFQNAWMVQHKKWFSRQMLVHIGIVFVLTLALSGGMWLPAILIAVLHWITDGLKVTLQRKYPAKEARLFIADQLTHLLTIIFIWAWHAGLLKQSFEAIQLPFLNYQISLVVLAYAFMIWPLGYFIKYALPKITPASNDPAASTSQSEAITQGGRTIGQFERIIILTFVLLGQYEAIGFLITGKSIIRFAQHNENLRSEYVLVGTMISFGLSIITGELVNWLLKLAA